MTFDSVGTFTTEYDYDLDGRLTKITYPSGREVTRTYAAGGGITSGRLAGLSSVVGMSSPLTLLGSTANNAAGQITARTLGSSIAESRSFNSRLQLTGVGASVSSTPILDLDYGYDSMMTANMGRIRSRTDQLQPEHSVDYTYDAIGRLTAASAANSSWSVGWALDRYGNRTSQTRSGLAVGRVGSQSISYMSGNKNTAWTYDAAGNVTIDDDHTYTWDAENRLVQVDSSSNQYAYDAAGRRVKRIANEATTYYLYGLTGLQSEFSTSVSLSNAYSAASTDRVTYRVGDPTGTAVLLMDSNGVVRESNRVFPFGEPWQDPVDSKNTEAFTTYQHDDESGLDYAVARYYASRSGRFMTPDPGHVGASLGDPQSWNAYVYTENDPVDLTDPTGLYIYIGPQTPKANEGGSPPDPCIDVEIGKPCLALISDPFSSKALYMFIRIYVRPAIKQLQNATFNTRCEGLFSAISALDKKLPVLSTDTLISGLTQATFGDGMGVPLWSVFPANSVDREQYRLTPSLRGITVAGYMRGTALLGDRSIATSDQSGNNIYINVRAAMRANMHLYREMGALLFHERTHNVGFSDYQIMKGLSNATGKTVNYTDIQSTIRDICF